MQVKSLVSICRLPFDFMGVSPLEELDARRAFPNGPRWSATQRMMRLHVMATELFSSVSQEGAGRASRNGNLARDQRQIKNFALWLAQTMSYLCLVERRGCFPAPAKNRSDPSRPTG